MSLTGDVALFDVVEKVYATALDDSDWSAALDPMADLFGAVGVSFEVFEVATNKPIFIELGSNLSMVSAQEYVDYYGRISPRVVYNIGKPSGFISYDHMFLTEADMDTDEFYQDCLVPVDLRYFLAAQVYCSASHQAVFAAQRSPRQGHVGDEEIATLKRLLPHLQQAIDLKFRLAAARIEGQLGLEGLGRLNEGCLIVDRAGQVLHANAEASDVLARADGISLSGGRLTFADRTAARRHARALAQLSDAHDHTAGATTSNFPARRRSGQRPYLVSVRAVPRQDEMTSFAWPAAGIVFVRDPDRFDRLNTQLLSQSYGLSAAEADLAAALDRGLTLREIAQDRSVSITTVRSQLYALMAKLDVHRQTDLVRLLANYRQPFT